MGLPQTLRRLAILVWALLFGQLLLSDLARLEALDLTRVGLEYGNVGASLVRSGTYGDAMGPGSGPTAWVPPFLSGICALVFTALGPHTRSAAAALYCLKDVCLALGWALLCRQAGREGGARGLGLSLALMLSWRVTDESLLIGEFHDTWLTNVLGLVALLELLRRQSPNYWLAALLPLANPVLAAAYGLAGLGRRAAGPALAAIALSAGVWTLRNQLVLGRPYPVKSNLAFELAMANRWDDDGVISRSTLLEFHPLGENARRQLYLQLGEPGFLDWALTQVSWQDWLPRCGRRLVNSLLWTRSELDLWQAHELAPEDRALLERAHLMHRRGAIWVWNYCQRGEVEWPPGLAHPAEVAASRQFAREAYRQYQRRPLAIWRSLSWAAWPTLAMLAIIGRRDRRGMQACAFYLVYLTPYVLVQHYSHYQMSMALVQAYLLTRAWLGPVRSSE